MDHKQWREYEEKCIQERPAACVATCPVHVDARRFMVEMKAGNFNKAYEIYRKSVPFPGIIARMCDHPCESACKRGEVGDPIAIAALEKACVQLSTANSAKIALQPKKGKRVAVVGTGLSGLAAAYELAVKGFGVVVFETADRLGGDLWEMSEEELPQLVIAAETSVLETIGVEIRFRTAVGEALSLQDLRRDFDAVYLGLGRNSDPTLGLELDSEGRPHIDPVTFTTSAEGVFAGGGMRIGSDSYSPIVALSDGKRAAISIDRYTQKVSLTAARENEGSYATSLYTSMAGIEALPVVAPDNSLQGYTREEAMQEADRCIECQCMECVKQCEYLDRFRAYPKIYARQINQNLRIVKGVHGANNLINSCTLCGLCKEVCPVDFDMSKIVREARTEMVKSGHMPPSAHDFPLQDMAFSNSEEAAFTRHQPGLTGSRYVFFPGCQLSGSTPGHVEKAYAYLTEKLDGGVGMMSRCCGAPAEWAGHLEEFQEGLRDIKGQLEDMGNPRLILACSTCYQTFKNHLPELDIVSLWELYDQFGLPEETAPQKPGVVAVHDACTTRYEKQIHDSVRNVLRKLDFKIEELPNRRETTECCGAGGLVQFANRKLANDMAKRRADESSADYVAYCAMCRESFAAQGKKAYHILDLIFGEADLSEPAKRAPSHSRRRDNRSRLKYKMLTEIWGEKVTLEEKPHRAIKLALSAEIEKLMEERLVLEEDIQRVIEHAERTGSKILNRQNGHILAFHKPVNVTYWVEYSRQEDLYVVHNVYSHRMDVEGNKS